MHRRHFLAATNLLLAMIATAPAFGDDQPTVDQVLQAWRHRQATTETLYADVSILTNYSAGSFVVAGKEARQPVAPRSSRRSAQLNLSGSQKWRIEHRGEQFHRRFGQMLHFNITRICDGNRCVLIERPYSRITDWQPQPREYRLPTHFRHENGWFDITLTPLLLHHRPFNALIAPFAEMPYAVDRKSQTIQGEHCVLFRPSDDAPYSVSTYRYWIAPAKDFSVLRIERWRNDDVEWSFDIEHEPRDGTWQPSQYIIRRMRQGRMVEFSKVSVEALKINEPIDDSTFDYQPATSSSPSASSETTDGHR